MKQLSTSKLIKILEAVRDNQLVHFTVWEKEHAAKDLREIAETLDRSAQDDMKKGWEG